MVNFNFKENYNFEDLLKIMEVLRSDEGCPWDREQTHESIRKDFIEETYEVIEAINKKDKTLLCEELGDVLLQVAFHVQIEKEEGSFGIEEVTDGVCKKLIERHPHDFGEVKVSSTGEVLDNWDTIKRKSKGQKAQGSAMEKIPKELPALMRAQKIQQKAKKAGFDWDDISGAYEALGKEIEELKEAQQSGDEDKITDELGDVLFSVVNISRFLGADSEEALTKSNNKFIERYLIVERLAKERDIDMPSSSIEELDKLWDEAKDIIRNQ